MWVNAVSFNFLHISPSSLNHQATVKLTRALEEEAATGRRPTHREPYRVRGTFSLGVSSSVPLSVCLSSRYLAINNQQRVNAHWIGLSLQVAAGPHVDTIDSVAGEVAHCNRNLEMIRQEAETTDTLEGEVQAAVVTLDLVRVATAFKKLPFQASGKMDGGFFYLVIPSHAESNQQTQEDIRYFYVEEAPAPKHMLWQNLTSPSWARRVRTGLVWTAVFALILGYTIPVGFASSLANLQGLARTKAFSWLKPILDISPVLTSFIQGFLPPLVVALFLALLPNLLKYLSRQQGFSSEVRGRSWASLRICLLSNYTKIQTQKQTGGLRELGAAQALPLLRLRHRAGLHHRGLIPQ
jgi:hypothetical protein